MLEPDENLRPGTEPDALPEDELNEAPPEAMQVTVIKPSRRFVSLGLRDIWTYRELLYYLIWRDVKVRYKQTLVGVLWVVVQPVATMLIFTFVFGRLANLPTDGVPYPLFVFSGLLPWQLFAAGLTNATASIVGSGGLISKVYFPRLIIPISSVIAGLIDFAIALCILIGLMVYYDYTPGLEVLSVPLFILLAITTALAVGLWLSMLNVRFRDVQYTVPFLTQAWLFLTPVAYASGLIPPKYRLLIGINPMTSVVDGFRWAFVGAKEPFDGTFALSVAMVLVILVSGIVYFRRMEKTFADIV